MLGPLLRSMVAYGSPWSVHKARSTPGVSIEPMSFPIFVKTMAITVLLTM